MSTNQGVSLSDLNGYMKNIITGRIVPSQFLWNTLHDALKSSVQTDGFNGDLAEILIQTGFPYSGGAFGENIDIPHPQSVAFVKQYIPLKQIIVNAGITSQALDRAVGGGASWGRAVDMVLEGQRAEFMWLREILSIGDGTGRLARVASVAGNTTPTITVDNNYKDFGWDDTALIKPGMWIEILSPTGVLVGDVAGLVATAATTNRFQVTAVASTNRNNGAASTATGTITLAPTTNDLSAGLADGAVIYIAGSQSAKSLGGLTDSAGTYSIGTGTVYEATNMIGSADIGCTLPMGLTGLVANPSDADHYYSDGAVACALDTFQGLARASYATLKSSIYGAGDFGGTDGTPADWDLSVISDAINQNNRSNGGKTNVLLCSSELAMAIMRRNRSESSVNVNISNTNQSNQNVVGSQFASTFLGPNGESIPIKVSNTVPRNCLYGLNTDDLHWYVRGTFDFMRLDGEIWSKSFGDRKANFEAPFGGYENIGADRCDRQFLIQDMADNI